MVALGKRKRPSEASPTPSESSSPSSSAKGKARAQPPAPAEQEADGSASDALTPADGQDQEEEDIFLRATNAAAAVAQAFVPPKPGELAPYYNFSFSTPRASSSRATRAGTAGSSPRTPTPKKRKKADPDAPVEEKRLARFKSFCPQNIQDRVDRVLTQRFYLIDRERDGDELRETFKVLGSTGNVYTVTIDKIPTCNCPDALKGNHCKHILFVFLKVLNVSQYSKYYYQKALLSTELAEIFNNAPAAPTVIAAERVRAAYVSVANGASSSEAAAALAAVAPKRLPQEGDDCPICYECMPVNSEQGLVFCRSCGNPLHKECFVQWARTPNGRTCVTCRAAWPHEAALGLGVGVGGNGVAGVGVGQGQERVGGAVNDEGYINVAGLAGISPVRDTSTYYHGPRRRGSRRAYWDDDELYE